MGRRVGAAWRGAEDGPGVDDDDIEVGGRGPYELLGRVLGVRIVVSKIAQIPARGLVDRLARWRVSHTDDGADVQQAVHAVTAGGIEDRTRAACIDGLLQETITRAVADQGSGVHEMHRFTFLARRGAALLNEMVHAVRVAQVAEMIGHVAAIER